MLVLGLGSNIGQQLDNLRNAIKQLRRIPSFNIVNISPVYQSNALLPANAPKIWQKTFLNAAVACQTSLSPKELLHEIKKIERAMGRYTVEHWAPRIIDIDILAWDKLIYKDNELEIPHPCLSERNFALWPLLDILPEWKHPLKDITPILKAWGSKTEGFGPYNTQQITHRIDTSALVGILNITADSFSDGGKFNSIDKAISHAKLLFKQGAEVIDIGAESTRPNAKTIDPIDEWQSLSAVLKEIHAFWSKTQFKPKISIDTRHAEVAEKALAIGADWLNDVSGFDDPQMRAVAANSNVKCIVMHHLGIPPCANNTLSPSIDIFMQLKNWAKQRFRQLEAAKIDPERIIFDVGIGFGKTPQQSLNLLKNIQRLQMLNVPLLVGHSRKSFLNLLTSNPPEERDIETALFSYHLAQQQVDYLRVHNVAINAQALKIASLNSYLR